MCMHNPLSFHPFTPYTTAVVWYYLHSSCCGILFTKHVCPLYMPRIPLTCQTNTFSSRRRRKCQIPWFLIVWRSTWLWEGYSAFSKIRPVRGKYGQPVTCDILWHFCCPCQVLYLFFVKVLGKYTNRMFMMNDFHPSFSAQYIYFICVFANWNSVACVTCIVKLLDESIPWPLSAEIENRFHVFCDTWYVTFPAKGVLVILP